MKLLLLLLTIYLLLLSTSCIDSNKIFQGETKAGLRKTISEDLKKQLIVGLEKYKSDNGHYPISSGKYYLQYLLTYVDIPSVYIYQDILEYDKVKLSKNSSESILQDTSNLYIGCGSPTERLAYKSIDGKSYTLEYIIDK